MKAVVYSVWTSGCICEEDGITIAMPFSFFLVSLVSLFSLSNLSNTKPSMATPLVYSMSWAKKPPSKLSPPNLHGKISHKRKCNHTTSLLPKTVDPLYIRATWLEVPAPWTIVPPTQDSCCYFIQGPQQLLGCKHRCVHIWTRRRERRLRTCTQNDSNQGERRFAGVLRHQPGAKRREGVRKL